MQLPSLPVEPDLLGLPAVLDPEAGDLELDVVPTGATVSPDQPDGVPKRFKTFEANACGRTCTDGSERVRVLSLPRTHTSKASRTLMSGVEPTAT